MEKETHLREALKSLFRNQALGVLATQRDGQPYASLVAFVVTPDLRGVGFATSRATRKFANLEADPRAAILVDNRKNRETDFHEATAVTATGKVHEVSGPEKEALIELYLAKHPHLKEFVSSPTCALLRLEVEKYNIVSRFQTAVEVQATL